MPNAAYHPLLTSDLTQNWSNTSLITADNNWSAVPSIQGFRGDNLTTGIGVDPRTILADGSGTPINVLANRTNTNLTTGGVGEFHLANPVVALQGSVTADAPHLVMYLDATSVSGVMVSFTLRDIDGSANNAVQQVAVQYRVGGGAWANVPGGYVADATAGPGLAGLETPVSVVLPADADDQSNVQVRILTTNAAGFDEWVGVDDIVVTAAREARISGTVWNDWNRDGIRGMMPTDTGIEGVEVSLYDHQGTFLRQTVTNASGYYEFANLTSGGYQVRVALLFDYLYSQFDVGTDDSIDSDVGSSTGYSGIIYLASSALTSIIDAGIAYVPGVDAVESLSTETPGTDFDPNGEYSLSVADGPQDSGLYINNVKVTTTSAVYEKFKNDPIRKEILDAMMGAPAKTNYPDQELLEKGLKFRVSIVEAATKAAEVKLVFTSKNLATATDSDFWELDGDHPALNGGLQVRTGKKPSAAIDDIFANPSKYAFDCATMQMVIAHKGLRDFYGDDYDAKIKSVKLKGFFVDEDIRFKGNNLPLRPGDRVNFTNPHASRSEWLNENTTYVGGGKYLAPGMGPNGAPAILTEQQIIEGLNALRKNGATVSASKSNVYAYTLYPNPSNR